MSDSSSICGGVPSAKPHYCATCGVECAPDPEIPNCWVCPRCEGKLLSREVSDTLVCREALGVHGISSDTRDGIPVREFARHVNERGHASGTDVERGDAVQANVQRTLRPSVPIPRDPGGEQKRLEERNVVRLMLPKYNELHGTGYGSLASGPDEQGTDVIAVSQHQGEGSLEFQITFADTEGRLRVSIAQGRPYDANVSEDDPLARFAEALRQKSLARDPNAVLVLDGGGIAAPPGTVERFVRRYRHDLETAPFREVWWVDHAHGGVVRRLWPFD